MAANLAELEATALALAAPGKGLLASDESIGARRVRAARAASGVRAAAASAAPAVHARRSPMCCRPPQTRCSTRPGTIGKRLEKAGIENTEENRRAYRGAERKAFAAVSVVQTPRRLARKQAATRMQRTRPCATAPASIPSHPARTPHLMYSKTSAELFYTAPGIGSAYSGVIMFKETLFQSTSDGTPFVRALAEQGVMPGVKVDEVRGSNDVMA